MNPPEPLEGEADAATPAAIISMRPRRLTEGGAGRPLRTATWQTNGSLALHAPARAPQRPALSGATRLVDAGVGVPEAAVRTAVVVARGLLEVLSGVRPPSQLARWTGARLQYDLEQRAPRRPTGQRQQLLRVRIIHQAPGTAEACALTRDLVRDRVRVMALRLELRGEQWIVTRLSTG